MERYWDECSAEEKAEVKQIEDEHYRTFWLYAHGRINHRKYSNRLTRLIHKLDAIEKYETEEM